MSIDPALLAKFIEIVGAPNALTGNDDLSRYTHENRGIYVGKTPLVMKPQNTAEVSRILALANETGTPIVPQGGHTGHVGGAVPSAENNQIVVSLERMRNICAVSPEANTMVVEAGVTLQEAQEVAREHDRFFPLSIGSKGSCQIGGNIATNAGGTAVLAFGNMREQVLGLEVVLPGGEIWDGLRGLKKDNTGLDLKHLFIGSEGTLGIITAAMLMLRTKPVGRQVAFCGVTTPAAALQLFHRCQERAGSDLTGFELMPRIGLEFVLDHIEGTREPLTDPHPWYVLIEIQSTRSQAAAEEALQAVLHSAIDDGLVLDAALAQTETQNEHFWHLRESLAWAQKPEGGSIKHDVSVPVHRVPEFLEKAGQVIDRELPGGRICAFGHLGDGNIHYNITQPKGVDTAAFLANRQRINDLVHELVVAMDGSISAEHGIGQLKRDLLARVKSSTELSMMRAVKKALDPKGIMNPGKVL